MRNPITVDHLGNTIQVVAANPISASVGASLKVATNPFRKNRVSFSEAYNRIRQYSLFYERTDTAVKECGECDASTWGVSSQFHRAGQRLMHDYGNDPKYYERDTFCEDHVADAMKCQSIYRGRHSL